MAQIFHRSTNFIARFSVFSFIFIMGFAVLAVLQAARSPYMTRQNITREQPVQFSHKHHVGDDGIDCRYCHTSVEISAVAGIPPTKTCMNCHSVLFSNAGYLDPVRESYRTDTSIEWVKVHRLADFVYFNHSIHVNKGVGCTTCHGPIDQMPLLFQASTLLTQWDGTVDRRDVLQVLAASLAMAGRSGCERVPEQHIAPCVKQPDGLGLGKPQLYATAMPFLADAIGLRVESHEGRPTKIEGNSA